MKIQIEINGIEDRQTIAAILVANGYTVRLAKVKDTRVKTVVEAEKELSEEQIGERYYLEERTQTTANGCMGVILHTKKYAIAWCAARAKLKKILNI